MRRASDTDLDNVLYERKGDIAYVTLNRPKFSMPEHPTWGDLRTHLSARATMYRFAGIILTGAGDKAFIAGADITELAHVTAFEAQRSSRLVRRFSIS